MLFIGFVGCNGPIFTLLMSESTQLLYVGGAFNNFPSVIGWKLDNASIIQVAPGSILLGSVASLAEVSLTNTFAVCFFFFELI